MTLLQAFNLHWSAKDGILSFPLFPCQPLPDLHRIGSSLCAKMAFGLVFFAHDPAPATGPPPLYLPPIPLGNVSQPCDLTAACDKDKNKAQMLSLRAHATQALALVFYIFKKCGQLLPIKYLIKGNV